MPSSLTNTPLQKLGVAVKVLTCYAAYLISCALGILAFLAFVSPVPGTFGTGILLGVLCAGVATFGSNLHKQLEAELLAQRRKQYEQD